MIRLYVWAYAMTCSVAGYCFARDIWKGQLLCGFVLIYLGYRLETIFKTFEPLGRGKSSAPPITEGSL
jgi:hypothetical protein